MRKGRLLDIVSHNAKAGSMALALYIHWPFCVAKCPYCDFNSHVRDRVDIDVWRTALRADMAHEARLTEGPLGSIFFGGGTPSLMPPALVGELIAAAEAHWGFEPGIEITLEANPSSVEAAAFGDLAAAGVNRVSLGVQSFDDAALRFLGRAHDADEAREALTTAQRHFARMSFDLIYALPDQSRADWQAQLDEALARGSEHLSLYQLTFEPGTRFATDLRRGDIVPMDEDRAAAMFEYTQERLTEAGLPAYEVSNHARPGTESRHNLTYWRYQPYVGIGPGAHGRRGGPDGFCATERHKKPENYLSATVRNMNGLSVERALPPAEQAAEALMMGLRLAEGLDLAAVAARTGLEEGAIVDRAALDRHCAQGLLRREGTRIVASEGGRLVLNALIGELLPD